MLERFLMCCGKYKNELYRQNTVNKSLIEVSKMVLQKIEEQNKKKKNLPKAERKNIDVKKEAEKELYR